MRQVGLVLDDGFQLMTLAALAAFELANLDLGDDGYRVTLLSGTGGLVQAAMHTRIETVPAARPGGWSVSAPAHSAAA